MGKSRDAQFLIFAEDTPLCCTSCIISRPSTQPIVSLCIFYVCVTLLYHCVLRGKWLHVSTSYRVILRLLEPTEAKLQLPVSLEHFTYHFAWRLAPQSLPLFLFAVSRGQRVLFQYISVSMKFDSLYLKKALEGYTPTITCCNGTFWIKMEFSVDPSARVIRVSRKHKD